MIRVDIESIIMSNGPVPSVVVLRERKTSDTASDVPMRALSIQTGTYEAAAIGQGVDFSKQTKRPIPHDLLVNTVRELGAKIERVEITRWDAPVFFANIVLEQHAEDSSSEVRIDARPSDALAIATRSNAPIYVEDDVMNRAGSISVQTAKQPAAEELERFDEFVQTLSPDDF